MGEPEAAQPQPQPAANDDDRDALPDEVALAQDAARVVRAAAELGVEVPDGFLLTGVDKDGEHTAFLPGTASDLKIGVAILQRLNGNSVADCLARMEEESQPEPRPEWMPPDDWNDAEAWQDWMTKRARHPEWPAIYNAAGDWLPLVTSSAGLTALVTATASVLKQRDRIKFAKWLVSKAEERGLPVDPVAVIRAFERGAPEKPTGTSTQGGPEGHGAGRQLPPEPPPVAGDQPQD